MAISLSTRQAYSEVEVFLSLLEDEQINKVPKQLIKLFQEEKDYNYKKIIDPSKPIKDQDLKEETLAIISLLNLEYWCDDEQEKERLRKTYYNNQKAYEEVFQITFDPDKIFKKDYKTNEMQDNDNTENIGTNLITFQRETIVRKIIRIIKRIFNSK